MKAGSDRVTGKDDQPDGQPSARLSSATPRAWPPVGLALVWLAGCVSTRSDVEHNLMADRGGPARNAGVAQLYRVACPDLLTVEMANRPDLSGRYAVGPDGRIDMALLGMPRVEGQTPPQIAESLAEQAGLSPTQVAVHVADYQSQQLYLFGQVHGLQRTVPYQGQETVLDLLQRIGGITPGAEPGDVFVIRSRVAEGQRPEVFHVDLRAIVLKHDQRTNIRLLPFDQIHVGETRQALVERCIPLWLRPFYKAVWDTRPKPSVVQPPEGNG